MAAKGKNGKFTEAAARENHRRARREFAPEEKFRIVLEGLRGEQGIPKRFSRLGLLEPPLHVNW